MGIIKSVRKRWSLKGVSWGKVILHKPWRKSIEVVRVGWLVELRWMLLMRGKRPSKMWRTLHAKRRVSLRTTPWRLFMLITPRSIKLVIPWRFPLAVPCWFWLIVPVRITVIPHTFMAIIPWRTVWWGCLVMRKRGLFTGLLNKEKRQKMNSSNKYISL